MKTNDKNEIVNTDQSLAVRCVQSCKKLFAEIEQAKNKIASEFQETLDSHSQLFQLALNEAGALAFQTDYPHLFFPTLAVEKIQVVSAWQSRQKFVQQRRSVFARAV